MSPNTGECILNTPKEVIVYDHFPQWSKNGVTKNKGTNDGECIGVSYFPGVQILIIIPQTYLQYLKISDYQVVSVKNTKPFRDLHTCR